MRRLFLLTSLISLAVPAAAAEGATSWTVRGAGFGHGIGMSQYGAYGFAQNGRGHRQILAHYYRGTKIGTASSRKVQVLLQERDPFVRVSGATRASGGRSLNPGTTYIARSAGGGRVALSTAGGRRIGSFGSPLRLTRSGDGSLRLLGPAINGVNGGRYRAGFELHSEGGGVTAVNALPIDEYVRGVVAGEMPSSWHIEALKAQAVAARTYALATRKTSGIFDQYPDTRSQVYLGVTGETARTDTAIRRTSREIVTYDGEPAVTYYSSTSGGRTENIENSFIGAEPKPWLKSVRDPFDGISPKHRWRFRFSTGSLGAKLGAPGTLRKIRVLKRGVSPRIVRARVYGTRGSRVLSGPDIRARLGLFDTWAFFTQVSSSQRRRPRGLAATFGMPKIAGAFSPAPRSRMAIVERRRGRRWTRVGDVYTSSRGRYDAMVARAGIYRVRSGAVTGPAVRVRPG